MSQSVASVLASNVAANRKGKVASKPAAASPVQDLIPVRSVDLSFNAQGKLESIEIVVDQVIRGGAVKCGGIRMPGGYERRAQCGFVSEIGNPIYQLDLGQGLITYNFRSTKEDVPDRQPVEEKGDGAFGFVALRDSGPDGHAAFKANLKGMIDSLRKYYDSLPANAPERANIKSALLQLKGYYATQ